MRKHVYLILANNSGGLYRFRKDLMERLILDGNEVCAVTPFDESIIELKKLGIRLIELEINRRGANPIQEIQLLFNYTRIIRSVNPDIIITYTIKPGIYGGMVARWMKIPYVVNITGLGTAFERSGSFHLMIVKLWKIALKAVRCVFFENTENAQVFQKLSIIEKEKVHVLNGAGVNLIDFPLTEYPEDRHINRFLFIGRVMHEKGIDELLGAIEQLRYRHQDITLDVVGWCEEDYQHKLYALQERGIIQFYGFQTDVKPFIAQSNAFVLPSYHEGMANTLLEAAAMGRPIITSKIHGCMEAVVDGETGLLCEVKNTDALIHQLENFINLTYDQKRDMGRKAHIYVSENFDKRKIVQETVEVLYGILDEHNL